MLTERPIHTDLKNSLLNNEPFVYAHLIKFERPSRPDANGRVSTSKERYAYLTDASRNVDFDDGSANLLGTPNGTQTYLANKVLKVGNVTEQTEARASNYSLTLDGNGIGAYIESTVTITQVNSTTWDLAFPASVDLLRAGFREGDKVTLGQGRSGDFNIINFRENNVLRVGKVDNTLTVGAATISMALSSEEIKSILLDKNAPEYASFVNREVFIYRAYFEQGEMIGAPVLLFKGIISNVSFEETDANIQVTWGLTSHWGDFAQVKGRITSDDYHRALDQNGIPQPQSALKTAYAYDKGFTHSETSINLLATYSVQVEKQDVRYKNGFFGIGAKVKVKKYFVAEDRNTELDFQLQAKSIPVIYGVRNTPGIPVFADTLNSSSATVYVAHVLSEGEIGGIYDAYIDGNSLICNDKADFDARSTQTADNTVELICRGRADRGDVLGGVTSIAPPAQAVNYYDAEWDNIFVRSVYNYLFANNYTPYVAPAVTSTSSNGKGIIDGESIQLTSPQSITIDVFSGKPGQKAASQLVEIAKANNFKIQNSYWGGSDANEYWGPNHRLLDTAYVVAKYVIQEGETTIPNIEFIVKGKNLQCYNYDYSYSHYTKATGESADNFKLGDMVTLYNANGTAISGQVQIIDKWTFVNPDGSDNTRFRFSSNPNLGYVNGVPTVRKFYMQNAGGQRWTMVTFNYEEFRGTVGTTVSAPVTGVVNDGGNVAITYPATPVFSGGDPVEGGRPVTSLVRRLGFPIFEDSDLYNTNRLLTATNLTTTQYTSRYPVDGAYEQAQAAVANNDLNIISRNTLILDSSASTTDDYYNGYLITVYRYDAATDKQYTQTKRVLDYVGSTKTITIDDIWDADIYPQAGDVVVIVPPYTDSRVSINPAIQSLDYISSSTYGRGLDPLKDLDLPSWLSTARVCDTQSNVTVNHTNTVTPTEGKVYRYPASGDLIWQGEVIGSDGNFTEFTKVIGKLSNSWNSWKSFKLNELVYTDNRLYKVTIAGVKTTQPTHTSGTQNGLEYVSTGSLTLTSTNSGPSLTLFVAGNPVRAEKNGTIIPGYSLYDCDEVTYWRYLGWDEFSQRYVTRHQTNLIIDTSLPLFDNMNSLLEHFGGILRYSGGKYYLDIEELAPEISNVDSEVRNITADHIIGKIRLTDEGARGAYNSLTAAFADPANKFESKNISFFNSEFLKADRNVPKKGNLSIPGITNYYNTRILADKYLNKSRFGLNISFNMAPRGLLLLSGMVIQLQYPRYGWVNKKFRIINLTHQEDCTVDIVAEEYDDSFYVISKLSKQAGSSPVGTATIAAIGSPTDLRASNEYDGDEVYSGVRVTWTNNPGANTRNVYTELFSSYSSQLYVNVTNINNNILTTTVPHELVEGELIKSTTNLNGLEKDKSYFIKSIISPTQFTLSESKNGSIKGLTNGIALSVPMMTASLIATLPVPINSFVDTVGSAEERISKFYWVRHKVIKV